MKRNIIKLLAAIGIVLSFVSCSKKKGELELYDMGKATFKEPFVGLLKSHPGILVKSLKYPPYSWAAPDTAFVEKTFKISFNEDCVRSCSEAIVQIRDTHYVSSEGIRVFHNGEYISNGEFRVVADSLKKTMTLRYVLSPSLGKATIDGYILISGKELDSVNGKMLQQDNNVVGKWKCEQKIGWPIVLWFLWFLTALIILCILIGIIAGVIYLCYWIGKGIWALNEGGAFPPLLPNLWRRKVRKQTGWSKKTVKYIRTREEAQVYADAGLVEWRIKGKRALVNPHIKGSAHNAPQWPDWSNKELARDGYPPRDKNGRPFELHHIGQNPDSPLAELTYEQHHCDGNFEVLHTFDESKIDRRAFQQQRGNYWKNRAITL